MELKDAMKILERDKKNLNVNKIVDIPKEKSMFKRNLLLGAYQAIFDNIKEAIEVIVEALERLKEDNYKLDRENQLLFESQFNSIPKKKIEDKIEELKKEGFEYENKICTMYYVKQDEIYILQDLLEAQDE